MSAYARLGRLNTVLLTDRMTSGLGCHGCQIDLCLSFRRRSNPWLSLLVHYVPRPYRQFAPNPSPSTPGGGKWTRILKFWTGVTRKTTTSHTTPVDPAKTSVNLATTSTRIATTPCLWVATRMISASSTPTNTARTKKSPNIPKFLVTIIGTTTGSLHTVAPDSPRSHISPLHTHLISTRN